MTDVSASAAPTPPEEETYASLDARRATLVAQIHSTPGGVAVAPLSILSELAEILSKMRRKTAGPPKKEAKKSPKFVTDLFS